jgi:hypothetical protein
VVLIMLGMFANFVGIGLGTAAVAQKKAKKLFGVLGLIFNGCLILLITGLMLRIIIDLMLIGIMVS